MPVIIDGVELSDEQVQERLLAGQAAEQENAGLRKKTRAGEVDAKVASLTGLGFSEEKHAGFFRVVREIMVNDDEDVSLTLSEGGRDVDLTASDIAWRVIDALPKDAENRVLLGEQAHGRQEGTKPGEGGEEEPAPVADRAAGVVADLRLPRSFQVAKPA